MLRIIQPNPGVFGVLFYSMEEEILNQRCSHRKCVHFKIGDFFEQSV